MTLWEILKANKTGIAPDMFTMLAANKMNGGRDRLHELTGTPPLSFKAKGKPLSAWSITGNTVQDGTPTPENPVEVQSVGDYDSETGMYRIPVVTRGKNLFDYKTTYSTKGVLLDENGAELNYNTWNVTDYIPCSGKVFTINKIGGMYASICLYDSQKNFIKGVTYGTGSANNKKSITIQSDVDASYIRFSHYVNDVLSELQVEAGDTATPYEPYQEPITTPIYLPTPLYSGEVLRSDGTITRSDGTTETFTAPQIPTLNGTTVIDVDTAVKPESMTIKYRR